jgi:hypothetical protein
MTKSIISAIAILALPVVVFWGGAWVMTKLSGRQVDKQVKPLNRRWSGYDADAARSYWDAAEKRAPGAERRFLEVDLIFPFLYGGALAAALLMGWALLGRPFHPAWLLAPIAITLFADWAENLVQLGQLGRFSTGAVVEEGWIRVASAATVTKMTFLSLSWALLLGLIFLMLRRGARI